MRTLLLLLTLVISQTNFSQDIFHPGISNLLNDKNASVVDAGYIKMEKNTSQVGNTPFPLQEYKRPIFSNKKMVSWKYDTIPIPINETPIHPGNFAIQIDQDFLFRFPFSKNEDRNYTQGTAFVYSQPDLIESFFFWPLKKLSEKKKGSNTNKKA